MFCLLFICMSTSVCHVLCAIFCMYCCVYHVIYVGHVLLNFFHVVFIYQYVMCIPYPTVKLYNNGYVQNFCSLKFLKAIASLLVTFSLTQSVTSIKISSFQLFNLHYQTSIHQNRLNKT